MNEPLDSVHPQRLLEHTDWVRRLAYQLVSDRSQADDVAQSVWVKVLQRPPLHAANLRSWLAECVRNSARQLGRSESRREHREQEAARPEALPSTDELVERAQRQQALSQAVLDLEEPYRETLLLRYFEGAKAVQIAERMGVPAATVRTRVHRALARLRERFDGEYGSRETWCALFLPLAEGVVPGSPPIAVRPGEPTAVTASSSASPQGTTMLWKIALTPTLATAAVASLAWVASIEPPPSVGVASLPISDPSVASATAPVTLTRPEERSDPRRASLAVAVQDPPPRRIVPAAGDPTFEAQDGFVVDPSGEAVEGVELGLQLTGERVAFGETAPVLTLEASSAQGGFSLPTGAPVGKTVVTDARYALVARAARGEQTAVLVVAPVRAIEGAFHDPQGTTLGGVAFHLEAPASLVLPAGLRSVQYEAFAGKSDAEGRFSMSPPDLAGYRLRVSDPRYEPLEHTLSRGKLSPLELILEPRYPHLSTLTGWIQDPTGKPVEGAFVELDRNTTLSGPDGSFTLALDQVPDRDVPLVAAKAGLRPAAWKGYAFSLLAGEVPTEGLVLTIGGETHTISGRILVGGEAPRAPFKVSLVDGTPLYGELGWAELIADGNRGPDYVVTDVEGRFELSGLLDREYRLQAVSAEARALESGPVAAGTRDLLLELPASRPATLRGIVLGLDGQPIEGASVTISSGLELGRMTFMVSGPRGIVSDAEGRFEMPNAPRNAELLTVWKEGYAAYAVEPTGEVLAQSLEVTLSRPCDLQVGLDGGAFRVLDRTGRAIPAVFDGMPSFTGQTLVQRRPSGFPRVSVPEHAVLLEVLQGGKVIARRPLQLQAGRLNEIVP